ncbi:leucyl aminopeptidase family protein [Pimelobacter simplex]|uniref:Probable cytosol aminopeptidase n=1 Tax=Nocardioides simplex TaxID=2045 RepID=A0A0A1DTD4_NOCSI|nr:leucyl aminopeptidase family protein [Pimelobacter simplex]AIY19813.2 Cytosol aminopeptidase PepA [Pimelobacter simplex]GEB12742.1 leucyl aminopeptidase [Pimelobacter simplex]SFM55037.1 leucyl aminopeptidase [Pimelobacter simplex]
MTSPVTTRTSGPVLPGQVSPPEFAASELLPGAITGVDVVALPVLPGDDGGILLGLGAAELADDLALDLVGIAEVHGLTGVAGEVATVPVPDGVPANPALRLVLLVGVGAARPADLRRAGAAMAKAARDRAAVVTSIPAVAEDAAPDDQVALEAFVAGTMLGSFVFHWRSTGPEHTPVRRVVLAGAPAATDRSALERAVALGGAGWRSRLLATVPSNLKNPAWLATQAEEVAAASGLGVRVWDEKDLADEGFGGILGVGAASATPPRLIRLDYTPAGVSARAAKKLPVVVLVGKGITFDSGGLSIKPGASMGSMKRDMTGGAVVLATMAALADVDCPVRVIGLIAAAENAISGSALRPGDVLTHWGGRTTEVGNTDAEGRLVLADALAYAVSELDPALVVDIATLTGAVKVALGQQIGGLFATDDALAAALSAAGERAGEPLWRFPLYRGYDDKLASKVADASNDPGGAGAITAALFLRPFVGDVPWAHLDIASVGDVEKESYEWTVGPSGFGSRLLLSWLGSPEPLAGLTP